MRGLREGLASALDECEALRCETPLAAYGPLSLCTRDVTSSPRKGRLCTPDASQAQGGGAAGVA